MPAPDERAAVLAAIQWANPGPRDQDVVAELVALLGAADAAERARLEQALAELDVPRTRFDN